MEKNIASDGEMKRIENEIALPKKINISLSQPQFTQLCKAGFLTAQEKTGRIDIIFSSSDILALCKGSVIEKNGLDEIYKFGIINIDSYEIREIVKRSPMFSGIAESI